MTLKYREQTEGGWQGVGSGGRAKGVRGTKEGTYRDEPWVLYVSDESLNFIPEIIIILYVNLDLN